MTYRYFYSGKPYVKSHNNANYPIIILGIFPIKT